jgi:hypothetical protein
MAAERRRAAALDRSHHLQLLEADVPAVGLAPSGPWSRKMSATSRAGRPMSAARYAALPLPPLWRPHDRHRGRRARLRAEIPADACSDANQDRYVMTAARVCGRKAVRLGRRSSAGGDPARPVAPHPWLAASAEQRFDALFARPAVSDRPLNQRLRPLLPAPSTTVAMSTAAKSP